MHGIIHHGEFKRFRYSLSQFVMITTSRMLRFSFGFEKTTKHIKATMQTFERLNAVHLDSSSKTSQFAVRLHAWLHCLVPTIIGDRDFGIMTHRRCFVARSLVLWLVAQGLAPLQEAAIELCRNLQQHGFLKHVV